MPPRSNAATAVRRPPTPTRSRSSGGAPSPSVVSLSVNSPFPHHRHHHARPTHRRRSSSLHHNDPHHNSVAAGSGGGHLAALAKALALQHFHGNGSSLSFSSPPSGGGGMPRMASSSMFVSPEYVLGVVDDGGFEEDEEVPTMVGDIFFPWLFGKSDGSSPDGVATAAALSPRSSASSMQVRQLSLHFNKTTTASSSPSPSHMRMPPSTASASVPPMDSAALVDPLLTSIAHQLAAAREDAAIARRRKRSRRRLGRATAAVAGGVESERRRGITAASASFPHRRDGGTADGGKEEGGGGTSSHNSTTITAIVGITTSTDSIRTIIPTAASTLFVGLVGHTLEHALVASTLQSALQLAAMLCPDGRLGAFTIALRREDTVVVTKKRRRAKRPTNGAAATLASVFFGTSEASKGPSYPPASCRRQSPSSANTGGGGSPSTAAAVIRACTVSLSMTRQPFWHGDWWNTPLLALVAATIQADHHQQQQHHQHYQHTGHHRNSNAFSTSAAAAAVGASSLPPSGLEGAIGACAHRFIGRTLAKMKVGRRGDGGGGMHGTHGGGYRPHSGAPSLPPLPSLSTCSFIYAQWGAVRTALSQFLSGGGGVGPSSGGGVGLFTSTSSSSPLNRFIRLLCAIIIASELRLVKSEDIITTHDSESNMGGAQHNSRHHHRQQQQQQGEDALAAAALLDHALQPATKADWEGLRALTELMADLQGASSSSEGGVQGWGGEGRDGIGGGIDVDAAMASLLGVLRTGTVPAAASDDCPHHPLRSEGDGNDAVSHEEAMGTTVVETILCDTGVAPFHGRVLPARRICMLPTELGHMAVDMLEGAVGRRLGAGSHRVYPVEGSVMGGGAGGDGGVSSDWDGSSSSSEESGEGSESDDYDGYAGSSKDRGGYGMGAGTRQQQRGSSDGGTGASQRRMTRTEVVYINASACAVSRAHTHTAAAAAAATSTHTLDVMRSSNSILSHNRLLTGSIYNHHRVSDSNGVLLSTTSSSAGTDRSSSNAASAVVDPHQPLLLPQPLPLRALLPNLCYDHSVAVCGVALGLSGVKRAALKTIGHYANAMPSASFLSSSLQADGRSRGGYPNNRDASAVAEGVGLKRRAMQQLVCDATRIGLLSCHEGRQLIPPLVTAAEDADEEGQPQQASPLLKVTHSMGAVVYDAHDGGGGGGGVLLPWPKGLTRDQLESLTPNGGGGGGAAHADRVGHRHQHGASALSSSPVGVGGGGSSARLSDHFAKGTAAGGGGGAQPVKGYRRVLLDRGQHAAAAVGRGRGGGSGRSPSSSFAQRRSAVSVGRSENMAVMMTADEFKRIQQADIVDVEFVTFLGDSARKFVASLDAVFAPLLSLSGGLEEEVVSHNGGDGAAAAVVTPTLFSKTVRCFLHIVPAPPSTTAARGSGGDPSIMSTAPQFHASRFYRGLSMSTAALLLGRADASSNSALPPPTERKAREQGEGSAKRQHVNGGGEPTATAGAGVSGAAPDHGFGEVFQSVNNSFASQGTAAATAAAATLHRNSMRSGSPAGLNSTIRISNTNTSAAATEAEAGEVSPKSALPLNSAFTRLAGGGGGGGGSEQTVGAPVEGADGDIVGAPSTLFSSFAAGSSVADDDDDDGSSFPTTTTITMTLSDFCTAAFPLAVATNPRFVHYMETRQQERTLAMRGGGGGGSTVGLGKAGLSDVDFVRLLCEALQMPSRSFTIHQQHTFQHYDDADDDDDDDGNGDADGDSHAAPTITLSPAVAAQLESLQRAVDRAARRRAEAMASEAQLSRRRSSRQLREKPWEQQQQQQGGDKSVGGSSNATARSSVLPINLTTSTSSKLAAIVAEKKRRSRESLQGTRAVEEDGKRMNKRDESTIATRDASNSGEGQAEDQQQRRSAASAAVHYQIISGRRPSPSPKESLNQRKMKMASGDGSSQGNSSASALLIPKSEVGGGAPMDIGSGSFIVKGLLESRGGSEKDYDSGDGDGDGDARICSVTEVTGADCQRCIASCSGASADALMRIPSPSPFPVHYCGGVPSSSSPAAVVVEEEAQVSAFPHPRPSTCGSTASLKSLPLHSAGPMAVAAVMGRGGGGENNRRSAAVGTMTEGTLSSQRNINAAVAEAASYGEGEEERCADGNAIKEEQEEDDAHERSASAPNNKGRGGNKAGGGGTIAAADRRASISSRCSSRPQKAAATSSSLLIPPWRRKESLTDLVKLNANAAQRIDMRRAEATSSSTAGGTTPRAGSSCRADAASTDVSYIDLGTSPIRRRPPLSASSLLVRGQHTHSHNDCHYNTSAAHHTRNDNTSAEGAARAAAAERQRSVSFVGGGDSPRTATSTQQQQARKRAGAPSPLHHRHVDPSTAHHSHHRPATTATPSPSSSACFDCLVPSHFRNRSPTSSSLAPTSSQRRGAHQHHAHAHMHAHPLDTPPSSSSRNGSRSGTPITINTAAGTLSSTKAGGYAASGAFGALPADEPDGCGSRNSSFAGSRRGSAAAGMVAGPQGSTMRTPATNNTTAASSINVSAITAVLREDGYDDDDGDGLPTARYVTGREGGKATSGRQPTVANNGNSHTAPLRSVADFHALISATLGDSDGGGSGAYAHGGCVGEEGLGGSEHSAAVASASAAPLAHHHHQPDVTRRIYKI